MPLNDNRTDKVEGGDLWSPDVERVFEEAMSLYPPCGRQGISDGEGRKPVGRNVLIARYIQRLTGKVRTRKQISSHIQVLARRKARMMYSKMNATGGNNYESPMTSAVERIEPVPSTSVGVDGVGNSAFGGQYPGPATHQSSSHYPTNGGYQNFGHQEWSQYASHTAYQASSQYSSQLIHQESSHTTYLDSSVLGYPSPMAYPHSGHYPNPVAYQNYQYGTPVPDSTPQQGQPTYGMAPYWVQESQTLEPRVQEYHMPY